MRLTSDFWTAAFIRSVRQAGGFAYLARRGAEEAGAIFITQAGGGQAAGAGDKAAVFAESRNGEVNNAAGQSALYGPAPQVFYGLPPRADRLFMRLLSGDEAAIRARLAQELEFDPDIWIIEVENFADLRSAANLRIIEADAESEVGLI